MRWAKRSEDRVLIWAQESYWAAMLGRNLARASVASASVARAFGIAGYEEGEQYLLLGKS